MTLVDSNVLLDILTGDPKWLDWSVEAMDRCAAKGPLYINDIVYSELSVRSENQAALDLVLESLSLDFQRTPNEALFLAGKAFGIYRAAGGSRSGVLPDFFIGAHAQIARLPILTRDLRRYHSYFPDVKLIAPDR